MSLIGEVIARLQAAIDQAREAALNSRAAREKAGEAIAQAGEATEDTNSPLPEESTGHWQLGIDALEASEALLENGARTIEGYIAVVVGAGGPTSGPTPGHRAPEPERRPFKPMRTDPEKADEIRPYVGEPIAYATLYDDQGRKLVGVHSADSDGPARDADWRDPWGSYPRLRRHVEAHAAVRMHKDGHRQLAMYINMAPCKYFDGCETNLEALVPQGSRLFIHQVHRNGSTQVHMYAGTGEALRSDDGNSI